MGDHLDHGLVGEIVSVHERFRPLMLAVIGRAARDVHRKHPSAPEAADWLTTVGLEWLACLGMEVDPRSWAEWIRESCPGRWMKCAPGGMRAFGQ